MVKTILHTANAPKAIGPYSQAVMTDTMLYTSGQLGIDPETGKLASEVKEQARLAMKNIGEILLAAGLGYDGIVKTTIFLTDLADFQVVNQVYADFFQEDYPARSCVQVAALPLGAQVEIECVALRA